MLLEYRFIIPAFPEMGKADGDARMVPPSGSTLARPRPIERVATVRLILIGEGIIATGI